MFEPERQLRVLFISSDPGRLRYFEGPLEELARRGHRVHVGIERLRERIPAQLRFITELSEAHDNVSFAATGKSRRTGWTALGRQLRLALDHVHYLQPQFRDAPEFRARSREDAPLLVQRLTDRRVMRSGLGLRVLGRVLGALERAVPPAPHCAAVIEEFQPDIVLVTPYVWFGSPQTDWVRAGKRLGVRTGACMFSWDNLTSKGSIRELPDMVAVWNRVQTTEAAELHGVPADRIVMTGAQNWDHWFEWEPSTDRSEFCARVGLDASRPLILFLESSGYRGGAGWFVKDWVEAVRRSGDQRVREAGILVRPHPQVADAGSSRLEGMENVSVWPPGGEVPLDAASRRNFFDSLYHADAVVGVNTSAFIEAAIVDRPALTVLLPELEFMQGNTVHFRHLLASNDGPLRVARSIEEHVDQLAGAIAADRTGPAARRFVETFVRPFGLDVAATPRFVAEIELACSRAAAPRESRTLRRAMIRELIRPLARRAEVGAG